MQFSGISIKNESIFPDLFSIHPQGKNAETNLERESIGRSMHRILELLKTMSHEVFLCARELSGGQKKLLRTRKSS